MIGRETIRVKAMQCQKQKGEHMKQSLHTTSDHTGGIN